MINVSLVVVERLYYILFQLLLCLQHPPFELFLCWFKTQRNAFSVRLNGFLLAFRLHELNWFIFIV